jgi:hypothetical protein
LVNWAICAWRGFKANSPVQSRIGYEIKLRKTVLVEIMDIESMSIKRHTSEDRLPFSNQRSGRCLESPQLFHVSFLIQTEKILTGDI